MKTRIAVFSQTDRHWGGAFQYAKAFTTALAGLDPDHFEVRVWHITDSEWHALCVHLNFQDYALNFFRVPPKQLPLAKKIFAELNKKLHSGLDVIQCADLLAPLYPWSTMAKLDSWQPHLLVLPQMSEQYYLEKTKHLGVIHDLMHRYEFHFPEVRENGEKENRDTVFETMIAQCDAIIVDSRVGMDQLRECYPQVRSDQLHILPFTAFTEITECTPEQPQFSVPEKFFFYPAKFWLHKNHLGLARAVALLKEELPDLFIVAAGSIDANGYNAFLNFICQERLESHFMLPGYVSAAELSWLYRHARALVMPTFFGPTNIPPLEAMALGCPVAVSDIYGMRDECGEAALYFDPRGPEEIANVLRPLWTDDELCANLRQKGLARAKLYDVSRFNRQVLRIVKSLVAEN